MMTQWNNKQIEFDDFPKKKQKNETAAIEKDIMRKPTFDDNDDDLRMHLHKLR